MTQKRKPNNEKKGNPFEHPPRLLNKLKYLPRNWNTRPSRIVTDDAYKAAATTTTTTTWNGEDVGAGLEDGTRLSSI